MELTAAPATTKVRPEMLQPDILNVVMELLLYDLMTRPRNHAKMHALSPKVQGELDFSEGTAKYLPGALEGTAPPASPVTGHTTTNTTPLTAEPMRTALA